ncbi:Leucine-rich repeat 2 [Arabidopsis thaliana x Arabidopsis arenosa]|uniref:Leucine-rich repeat 2 n=1 Tax=Arabidopsis thaliana x Arabidopsis arenosa TaxID=1240361 RepID=A0A8T2F6S4_9BRAS|nr:Leucine-rich repeat 2 [Arabidopsis thaliana x Arabidopsis arenosa]
MIFLSKSYPSLPPNKLLQPLFSPKGGGLYLLSVIILTLTIPSPGVPKISEVISEVEDDIDHLICKAMLHSLSELHLQIISTSWLSFPSQVFTSTTLVKLSLGKTQHIYEFSPDTSLPALKVLLLDSIWFWDESLVNVFFAACPVLEDLTIRYNNFRGSSYVISSKSIKKLSVINSSSCYDGHQSIITLDTPNVVDFYYSGFPQPKDPHCNLDSVAKATLDLHFLEDDNSQVQNDADVKNLIKEIHNVKTLHLTCLAVEYQGSATELKHISHLLLKMECLEVVKVYLATEMNDLKKMQLTEDVVKLPAASSKVKLQVMGS